jgi:excinuclease UvrABC ATPase subunit
MPWARGEMCVGGNLVAKGTPEDVANNLKSYTVMYLKRVLLKG